MQTFAVCFGVFKVLQDLKAPVATLESIEGYASSIYSSSNYIADKVCYIESSISDGLSVSFLYILRLFFPSPLY